MTIRELRNYLDWLLKGGFISDDSEIQCESSESVNYEILGFTLWRNGDIAMKIIEASECDGEE